MNKLTATVFRLRSSVLVSVKRGFAFDRYKSEVKFRIISEHDTVIKKRGYVLLILPATAFGLGIWQIFRREWKLGLIKSMEERLNKEPVPLPTDLRDLKSMEYSPIKVIGEFLYDEEFVIRPRQRLDLEHMSLPTTLFANFSAPIGGLVVTPFKLADRKETILVARGWVPKEKFKPEAREATQVKGQVEVVGITRNHEERPMFVKRSKPEKNVYMFRDVESMARYHDTAPVYLEQIYDPTVKDGPIGGQTRVRLRNEHHVYILIWFTIGVASVWIWLKRFYKFH